MYARLVNRFSATRAGSWIVRHLSSRLDPVLFTWSNGRLTTTGKPTLPMLALTTVGRRSGEPRTVQLAYERDGDGYLVVASAMGQERHPDWRYNLEAAGRATVQLRGQVVDVTAVVLTDEEKAAVWPRIRATIPQMATYERRTDRNIRVFRLVPVGGDGGRWDRETGSLEGRVVAVTGAARGIGLATCRELTRRGARVAMGDTDLDELARVADELGVDARFELDVADSASFERFVRSSVQELGPLDVLVNNAGIMPRGAVVDEDDGTSARALAVNIGGVVVGTKLALAEMVPRGRGQVVNVASMLGELACPGVATYCATKRAVIGFTEAVRREVRESGVELTLVLPAFVTSDLTAGMAGIPGFRNLTTSEVAVAVADAIERPRRKVYVPRAAGALLQTQRVLPVAVVDAIVRLLRLDRVFLAGAPPS